MAKPKYKSRAKRWEEAVGKARSNISEVEKAVERLEEAMEELREIQGEYESWYDSLNEGLQASGTGQLLEQIKDLDLSPGALDLSEYESALDNAESMELPVPFRSN